MNTPLHNYMTAIERRDEAKTIAAERLVRDLSNVLDDLTDCLKSGIQTNVLRASRQDLIAAHKKLFDLLEDTK